MTLVGFKAQNHRQQVGKRGARPEVDNLATTPEVFAPLHERFGFTIDVAALPHNAKLPRYFTPEDDGLEQPWAGERVWCNPPYSDIESWVRKAWLASNATELIVMLLPANRTEQGWWQRHIEPARRDGSIQVEFLPGRLRFIKHGHDRVEPNQRPPFGCCLVIWGALPGVLRYRAGDGSEARGAEWVCLDCGAEVYSFKEGMVCSDCGRGEGGSIASEDKRNG